MQAKNRTAMLIALEGIVVTGRAKRAARGPTTAARESLVSG